VKLHDRQSARRDQTVGRRSLRQMRERPIEAVDRAMRGEDFASRFMREKMRSSMDAGWA